MSRASHNKSTSLYERFFFSKQITKMAAIKTTFVLLLIAFAMVSVTVEARGGHVGPCDQVCSRTPAERDECCRAHGHSGYKSCVGGRMDCY